MNECINAIILLKQIFLMQIEQEHPSTLSIHQLLSDHQNKVKVIRLLYHTLTTMGFNDSAQELQRQTNTYAEDQLQYKIKGLLKNKEYSKAYQLVQTIEIQYDIKLAIQNQLNQLQILQLIADKQYEAAIEMVTVIWSEDQQKQLTYLTMIATDQPIQQKQFQKKQSSVIEKCAQDSAQLKNIQKLFQNYLNPSDSIPQKKSQNTFTRIMAESPKLGLGKPNFIKLNPNGTLVCLVCQTAKQTQISIWSFSDKKIIMEHHWKIQNFGGVQMVSWNDLGDKVAICSHYKIARYDATKICEPIVVQSRSFGLTGKLLCCKWHPQGNLYFGGLFDFIFGVTVSGHISRTIRPFMRTRDLIFSSKQQCYSISATRSMVSRYNLKQQKIITSFQAKACFMDMYHDKDSSTIVVTNKQYIYFLNSKTLENIRSILSPNNEKLYKIQAFFVKNWLIVFNQRLTAILQNNDVTRHHNWADCDAVDIRAGKMITVKSTITLWQQQKNQIELQLQSNINQQNSQSQAQWYSQDLIDESQSQMHSISSQVSPPVLDLAEQENSDQSMQMQAQGNQIQIQYLQNSSNQDMQDDVGF